MEILKEFFEYGAQQKLFLIIVFPSFANTVSTI